MWSSHLCDQRLRLGLALGKGSRRHRRRCRHRLAAAARPGVASIGSVSGSESVQTLSTVAPCKESRVAASDLLPGCSAIRPHTPRPMCRDVQQRHARLDRAGAIGWPGA